jgi:hypothetical protein
VGVENKVDVQMSNKHSRMMYLKHRIVGRGSGGMSLVSRRKQKSLFVRKKLLGNRARSADGKLQ